MATPARVEIRDLEILRALLRVRYLTTRQLLRAFFSCPRVGRRRIQRLSDHDLIRPHTKGLPLLLGYKAWRLTADGLAAVVAAFPEEHVADGYLERVATGSLHHVLHREALADLYLNLVVPPRVNLAENDMAAHRRWAAEMRGRASALRWQPDGEVVLSQTWLGERSHVVPDAVIRSARLQRRVFVELDRSTKDGKRIRENLVKYGRILPRYDLQGDKPAVLYVVRSRARKDNLEKIAGSIFVDRPPGFMVLVDEEAVEWLREEVLSIVRSPAPEPQGPTLHSLAKKAYGWMFDLHGLVRANGMREALNREKPGFYEEGVERFMALYRSLKAHEEGEGQ